MTDKPAQLLLIEDDRKLGELVARFLRENNCNVEWAQSGHEADRLLRTNVFDLILCDLLLPDEHGFQIAQRLRRESKTPIIFITAIGNDDSHIEGLELGAVDYLVKPVDPHVLLARVRLHLRTRRSAPEPTRLLELPHLRLDAEQRTVLLAGTPLPLTRHEFNLLWTLVSHHGEVLHREFLFDQADERDYDGLDRTIDGRISRLRKKLEAAPGHNYTIKTVWGRGYLLCEQDAPTP